MCMKLSTPKGQYFIQTQLVWIHSKDKIVNIQISILKKTVLQNTKGMTSDCLVKPNLNVHGKKKSNSKAFIKYKYIYIFNGC